MIPLTRLIAAEKRRTTRMLNRITKEMNKKFGEKQKPAFRVVGTDGWQERSSKASAKVSDLRGQRTGGLSRFKLACQGGGEVGEVTADSVVVGAAWQGCLCEGNAINTECPEHGLFNRYDPAFERRNEKPKRGRLVGVKKY